MWPRRRSQPVVRWGRTSAELWRPVGPDPGRWSCVRAVPLGDVATVEAATEALRQLLAFAPSAEVRAVDLVVESAWLPVMLLPTGALASGRKALEAWARHRLADLYDDRGRQAAGGNGFGPVAQWHVIVAHEPGSPAALAFGLPPALKSGAAAAGAAAGVHIDSLQPALVWGWRTLAARRSAAAGAVREQAWWIWCEQDRALVTCWQRDSIVALEAGAQRPATASQANGSAAMAAVRWGLDRPTAVTVAGWNPPFDAAPAQGVRTLCLADDATPIKVPAPAVAAA